jgi:hypothetical protein
LKIIVISGSHSKIGKTTVLRNIQARLNHSSKLAMKVGHRSFKTEKPEKFFSNMPEGLEYISSLEESGNPDFLLIESNSILNYIQPDLAIFLKSKDKPEKDSARLAKLKADIIIDENFNYNAAEKIINEKTGMKSLTDVLFEQYKYIYG